MNSIAFFYTLVSHQLYIYKNSYKKEKEVLEEGQSISYLGSGTFGVCQKSEDGKYTIVKRIEVENKDDSLKMKNYVEGLKA